MGLNEDEICPTCKDAGELPRGVTVCPTCDAEWPEDIVERLQNGDDLSARMEAAALITELRKEVARLEGERDAVTEKEREADATIDHYFDLLNTQPVEIGERVEVPKTWLVRVIKELAEFDLMDFAGSGKDGNSTRLLREYHAFSGPLTKEDTNG